ncbi:MAG: hypothetical protein JNL60_06865 [Bacteroidia bacterium]|nr:hypothetical protein [Bacteroidia bacterium]
MFASLVVVYLITAVGIPVYFHYCGGELEEINYVMKGNNCCSGEEEDSESGPDDCCKDENYVLKTNTDFTFQKFGTHHFVKAVNELIFTNVFYFPVLAGDSQYSNHFAYIDQAPPPRLLNNLIIQTSVIRI